MQLSSSEVLGMHFIVKFNCLPIQKSKTAEMRTDQNLVCFMFKVMRVFYDDTSHFKHNFIAMHQRFQMSGFTLHLQRKVFFLTCIMEKPYALIGSDLHLNFNYA